MELSSAARRKQDVPSLPSRSYLRSPLPRWDAPQLPPRPPPHPPSGRPSDPQRRPTGHARRGRAASGERARPPRASTWAGPAPRAPAPGGHLAGAADTAGGGDAARGGRRGAALGVPEPPPNFSARGLTSGGRRSGAGRGERSFWKEPPPLLNMASSASSSLAGAESTPPAQVSAAPPPYLWLPARRGRAGGPGRGSREPEGRARAGATPGALLSWGWRAEPARLAEGTRSLRPLGGPAAPEGAGPKLRPRAEAGARSPPWRAREHPGEGGRARTCGAPVGKHLSGGKARPGARDALASVSRLWASVLSARPFRLRARLNPSSGHERSRLPMLAGRKEITWFWKLPSELGFFFFFFFRLPFFSEGESRYFI